VHTQREICQWGKSNDKSQIENQFTRIENKPRPERGKCKKRKGRERGGKGHPKKPENKLKRKLCVQIKKLLRPKDNHKVDVDSGSSRIITNSSRKITQFQQINLFITTFEAGHKNKPIYRKLFSLIFWRGEETFSSNNRQNAMRESSSFDEPVLKSFSILQIQPGLPAEIAGHPQRDGGPGTNAQGQAGVSEAPAALSAESIRGLPLSKYLCAHTR